MAAKSGLIFVKVLMFYRLLSKRKIPQKPCVSGVFLFSGIIFIVIIICTRFQNKQLPSIKNYITLLHQTVNQQRFPRGVVLCYGKYI